MLRLATAAIMVLFSAACNAQDKFTPGDDGKLEKIAKALEQGKFTFEATSKETIDGAVFPLDPGCNYVKFEWPHCSVFLENTRGQKEQIKSLSLLLDGNLKFETFTDYGKKCIYLAFYVRDPDAKRNFSNYFEIHPDGSAIMNFIRPRKQFTSEINDIKYYYFGLFSYHGHIRF